jgi:hypothetical protein
VRLVKLLRLAGSEDGLVEDYLTGQFFKAIGDMMQSYGHPPPQGPPRKLRRIRRRRR